MPLWLYLVVAKVLAEPATAPLYAIKALGAVVWQATQSALPVLGTWPAGIGLGVCPAKLSAVTPSPWQLAHPLVTPLWL
jgi:hypothetical protein